MFACERRTASFASCTNMSTNFACSASFGRILLMTRTFSKPSTPKLFALNTSAMPPSPRRSRRRYRPNDCSNVYIPGKRFYVPLAPMGRDSELKRRLASVKHTPDRRLSARACSADGRVGPGRRLLAVDRFRDPERRAFEPRVSVLEGGEVTASIQQLSEHDALRSNLVEHGRVEQITVAVQRLLGRVDES